MGKKYPLCSPYALFHGKVFAVQLTHGRLDIRRRRILHPDSKQLAGFLPLPSRTLAQRMLHPDGAGARAVCNATAAKPAFIGIQHNGWLAFL